MPFIEGTKCHSKKQKHETSAKCRLRQKHLKFAIKIKFQRGKKSIDVNVMHLIACF